MCKLDEYIAGFALFMSLLGGVSGGQCEFRWVHKLRFPVLGVGLTNELDDTLVVTGEGRLGCFSQMGFRLL